MTLIHEESHLQAPTLTRAKVTGVLGEYDHELAFPPNQDFAIIYGPNGVGKTKFLEIVHATVKADGRSLENLPYVTATLEFGNGSTLASRRQLSETQTNKMDRQIEFTYQEQSSGKAFRWNYQGGDFEEWLLSETSWRPFPLDATLWEEQRLGELVPLNELELRFANESPQTSSAPPEVQVRLKEYSSYLVETQRLRIEQTPPNPPGFYRRNRKRRSVSRISEQASKMMQLINEAQTAHSRITQQLDRTFPSRVLTSTSTPELEGTGIREKYNKQNTFRSRLGQVASLDLEDALSLPDRELNEWERRMLNLYLEDTDKKLDPFVLLLNKIELLEKIVNSRLLKKRLNVTAESGLTVYRESDGDQIDLDSLSSGEQHEIILMFDLLFSVDPGALVLIDEPEISLHIVWQLAFIPDVQSIAKVSNFRFVVATHSPQIINDAWARATRLGPTEAEFE